MTQCLEKPETSLCFDKQNLIVRYWQRTVLPAKSCHGMQKSDTEHTIPVGNQRPAFRPEDLRRIRLTAFLTLNRAGGQGLAFSGLVAIYGDTFDIRYLWIDDVDSLKQIKRKQVTRDSYGAVTENFTTLMAFGLYSANVSQQDDTWIMCVEARSGEKSSLQEYKVTKRLD